MLSAKDSCMRFQNGKPRKVRILCQVAESGLVQCSKPLAHDEKSPIIVQAVNGPNFGTSSDEALHNIRSVNGPNFGTRSNEALHDIRSVNFGPEEVGTKPKAQLRSSEAQFKDTDSVVGDAPPGREGNLLPAAMLEIVELPELGDDRADGSISEGGEKAQEALAVAADIPATSVE